MEKIVVLTGAGISAESGIPTFRDADGLWENHRIEDVATYDAWLRNPKLVLNFYNERRRKLKTVAPNAAHKFLKELENYFEVQIITQNVDDLHERAGSSSVLHLHGELKKARSSQNENMILQWEEDLYLGDLADDGSQLRPHIVWFGEQVPELEKAAEIMRDADKVLIIGTSMQVYPAASLYEYAPENSEIIVVNPQLIQIPSKRKIRYIESSAVDAVPKLKHILGV